MVAYDAVRQYEKEKILYRNRKNKILGRTRRIPVYLADRNYTTWELGNELYEILHMP